MKQSVAISRSLTGLTVWYKLGTHHVGKELGLHISSGGEASSWYRKPRETLVRSIRLQRV